MVRMCRACERLDTDDPLISFHRLPLKPEVRNVWIAILGLEGRQLPLTSFICSDHFDPSDLIRKNGVLYIRPNTIPVIPAEVFQSSPSKRASSSRKKEFTYIIGQETCTTEVSETTSNQLAPSSRKKEFTYIIGQETWTTEVSETTAKQLKKTASNVTITTSKENQLSPFEFVDPASLVEDKDSGFKSSNNIKKIKVDYDNVAIQVDRDTSACMDPQQNYCNPENISDLELEEFHDEIKIEFDSFSNSTKYWCDLTENINKESLESCYSVRRNLAEHSSSIRDIKQENSDNSGAIKKESCDITEVIKEESCDFTGDVKEETCGIARAISEESFNFTGDIKEDSCDFTLDIKKENCDIKQENVDCLV